MKTDYEKPINVELPEGATGVSLVFNITDLYAYDKDKSICSYKVSHSVFFKPTKETEWQFLREIEYGGKLQDGNFLSTRKVRQLRNLKSRGTLKIIRNTPNNTSDYIANIYLLKLVYNVNTSTTIEL